MVLAAEASSETCLLCAYASISFEIPLQCGGNDGGEELPNTVYQRKHPIKEGGMQLSDESSQTENS